MWLASILKPLFCLQSDETGGCVCGCPVSGDSALCVGTLPCVCVASQHEVWIVVSRFADEETETPRVSQSARASITKHHRLSGLKTTQMYFTRLEVRHQGASMVGAAENLLPGLGTAAFLLCAHLTEREREHMHTSSLVSLFLRTLIPPWGPTLMTSRN